MVAGGLGLLFPGVAVIGAGYALIVALAWHTREAAVLGIEHRDGVKFYVVPTPRPSQSSWYEPRDSAASPADTGYSDECSVSRR